jgi:hypothetical protein
MASAYRSTKPVQPGQVIELVIAIESPTTTRDQGVSGVEAEAQPLNKTVMKTNTRETDPIDLFITSTPYDFIVQDAG